MKSVERKKTYPKLNKGVRYKKIQLSLILFYSLSFAFALFSYFYYCLRGKIEQRFKKRRKRKHGAGCRVQGAGCRVQGAGLCLKKK
jgi:hypothetical protein